MANDKTLSDVLLLLTKVSSKTSDRVEKLEKIVGSTKVNKKKDPPILDQKKQQKTDENIALLTKLMLSKFGEEQKKPEEVIEKKQEVIVTSFGRDATKTLIEAFGGRTTQTSYKTAPIKEEFGFLDKLKKMLPMLGLVLGGLGGLISSLMSGDFGELWEKIKEGDIKGIFEKATKMIYRAVRPILQSLPIIGPIISFIDGIEEINKGNLVGGLKNAVQGMIGLLPIPRQAKAAIIGFVELLGTYIEGKVGKQQIPTGSGASVMAAIMKSIGLLAKTGLKFFKRIPIIGSLISFYEAYKAFEQGGPIGISKGLLNLASGIANLFPGYGTVIGIGLDVLSALIFKEEEEEVDTGVYENRIKTRDWYNKTVEYLMSKYPFKNLMGLGAGMGLVASGNYIAGFALLAQSNPVFGIFSDFMKKDEEIPLPSKRAYTVKDFLGDIVKKILLSIVNSFPEKFGIRYGVQKLLGIDFGVKSPSENNNLTPENENTEFEELEQLQLEAKKQQALKEKEANTIGLNAMRGYKINDFFKTSQGKLVIPDRQDNLIEFKIEDNLDKLFTKNLKTSQEGNDILKKYADFTSDIMDKQLKILLENNKLLSNFSEKISTPTNIISTPTIVSNNFNSDNSLRRLQGAPAY